MASSFKPSAEEAERVLAKADKAWAPSVFSFRLGPDVETAGPLFERASLLFKQAGDLPRAISSLERASQCQEKLGSPWHAGKHLEACATMSAQLLPEARGGGAASSSSSSSSSLAAAAAAADFARRAAALYAEGGRAGAGAEALGRAAKLLETRGALKEAAALCDEALDMSEADGREGAGAGGQGADLFRQAVSLALARGRWAEASSLFLRFGEACDRCGARASQARAYLGAVVAHLHAGDAAAAWATFQDVLPVGGGFASSEEAGATRALFDAYRGAGTGGEECVRAAVSRCGPTLRNLDAPAARLAVKLPSAGSDLRAMAAALGGGGRVAGGGGGEAEEEEEEDLT